jgi:hypothetical protein
MTSTSPGAAHPTRDAVLAGDYERAALRLLYGFLVALSETAPQAREELLHLMTERRRPYLSDHDQGHGHERGAR